MTTQTPAPKASSVSALLASLSSVPPPPQPPVKEDFLAMMLQALTVHPAATDNPPATPPAKEKPASTETATPDATTVAGLLLAMLIPPLPILIKSMAHKNSLPSGSAVPSVPPSAPNAAQSAPESKEQRQDVAATLTVQVLTSKEAANNPPLKAVTPDKEAASKTPPLSGTPVANDSTRMTLSKERNESAGRIEQKLPLTAVSAVSSADTGGPSPDGGAKTPLSFTWQEAPSEQLTIIDLSTKAGHTVAPVAESSADGPVRVAGPAPLDRVEQMISREVLSVRQTGAQTLGVALKLDAHTQLFLQLTTATNGLVQASVRCERGQFAPEDAQWAQLQQSLARQNVELLPMTGGSNLNFQQPSGQQPRQQAAREDFPSAGAAAPPAQPRKQKEQNRSRKNWESWA